MKKEKKTLRVSLWIANLFKLKRKIESFYLIFFFFALNDYNRVRKIMARRKRVAGKWLGIELQVLLKRWKNVTQFFLWSASVKVVGFQGVVTLKWNWIGFWRRQESLFWSQNGDFAMFENLTYFCCLFDRFYLVGQSFSNLLKIKILTRI